MRRTSIAAPARSQPRKVSHPWSCRHTVGRASCRRPSRMRSCAATLPRHCSRGRRISHFGPTEAAVAEENKRAGVPFDRIVPAVTVAPKGEQR